MPSIDHPRIDCHCHVIDPARFPFAADTKYRPAGAEIAPVEHLLRIMDRHGVEHALIVGTNSGYGTDLSPVLDAMARGAGRFKGIAVVANDITVSDLARLKTRGIIGVAFNAPFHGVGHYAKTDDLLRKMVDLDMILDLQVRGDELLFFLPAIERSMVRLVIDHCGRPVPGAGLTQPGFQALLGLGRAGRASVKLSGFSQFSGQSYPYDDSAPAVAALLDAFTPDRCVWGSDWPFLRAPDRIDYGPLLDRMDTLVPDATMRRAVLWDTPRRLFGFGAG